jgi:hypothetical protein
VIKPGSCPGYGAAIDQRHSGCDVESRPHCGGRRSKNLSIVTHDDAHNFLMA